MHNSKIQLTPEARQKVIAFKQTFGTELGKQVLKDLVGYCRIIHPSFVKREGQAADPLEMAFLDGRKDVFYYIKRILDLEIEPE